MRTWIFKRPDEWHEVVPDQDPIKWSEDHEKSLQNGGYLRLTSSADEKSLGSWKLYKRQPGGVAFSHYFIRVNAGNDHFSGVWLGDFPDLMSWMRLYGRLGEESAYDARS
jgi:hypothetical protein